MNSTEERLLEQEARILDIIENKQSYLQQGEDLVTLRTSVPRSTMIIDLLLLMKDAVCIGDIKDLASDAHLVAENSFSFLDWETINACHYLINQSEKLEIAVFANKTLALTAPINYRSH